MMSHCCSICRSSGSKSCVCVCVRVCYNRVLRPQVKQLPPSQREEGFRNASKKILNVLEGSATSEAGTNQADGESQPGVLFKLFGKGLEKLNRRSISLVDLKMVGVKGCQTLKSLCAKIEVAYVKLIFYIYVKQANSYSRVHAYEYESVLRMEHVRIKLCRVSEV